MEIADTGDTVIQERDSVVKRISSKVWERVVPFGKFEETPSEVLDRILDRLVECEKKLKKQ